MFSQTDWNRLNNSHIFLVVVYSLLLLSCLVLLGRWIIRKLTHHKKRNKWGYDSINNSDNYRAPAGQSQLPTSPSSTKGSWLQLYYIFIIIGCAIRIYSLSIYIGRRSDEESGLYPTSGAPGPDPTSLGQRLEIAFSFSGSYCFVLSFLIVMCCLAEVYHSAGETTVQQRVRFIQSLQTRSGLSSKHWDDPSLRAASMVKKIAAIIIIAMIFFIVVNFFFMFFYTPDQSKIGEMIIFSLPQDIAVIIYILIFIGFMTYGVLIFRQTRKLLRSFAPESNENLKKIIRNAYFALFRVTFTIFVSAFCFIFKAIVISFQIYTLMDPSYKDFNLSLLAWYVDLLFYLFLECFPLTTTLFIFGIIPTREKKDNDIAIIPIASY